MSERKRECFFYFSLPSHRTQELPGSRRLKRHSRALCTRKYTFFESRSYNGQLISMFFMSIGKELSLAVSQKKLFAFVN